MLTGPAWAPVAGSVGAPELRGEAVIVMKAAEHRARGFFHPFSAALAGVRPLTPASLASICVFPDVLTVTGSPCYWIPPELQWRS